MAIGLTSNMDGNTYDEDNTVRKCSKTYFPVIFDRSWLACAGHDTNIFYNLKLIHCHSCSVQG